MARVLLSQTILEPGTGKAFELLKGQVMRIEQVKGGQCVDFNAFNLHDYKEYMHCGRTRTVHGFRPTQGDFLWSQPPRENALLYLLADTYGRNDVLFPRCSAYLYESAYGYHDHTNCNDIQAEAQREYGLTPDDVHDSFNFFMCTEVNTDGTASITRQESKAGDYVEMVALMDVLAVPNICGADIMRTSNFSLKPVKVLIWEADEAELATIPKVPVLRSQRTPADFKISKIKATRELSRDPDYSPDFTNTPILETQLEITFDAELAAAFERLANRDLYGEDDGAALRDIFFSWWEDTFLTAANGAPSISTD